MTVAFDDAEPNADDSPLTNDDSTTTIDYDRSYNSDDARRTGIESIPQAWGRAQRIRHVTEEYLGELRTLDIDELPAALDANSALLARTTEACVVSATDDKARPIYVAGGRPTSLTAWQIATLAARWNRIRRIAHAGLPDKSRDELRVYQVSGPDKGLYVADESHLRLLVRAFDQDINDTKMREVIGHIYDSALRVEKNSDPDAIPCRSRVFDDRRAALRLPLGDAFELAYGVVRQSPIAHGQAEHAAQHRSAVLRRAGAVVLVHRVEKLLETLRGGLSYGQVTQTRCDVRTHRVAVGLESAFGTPELTLRLQEGLPKRPEGGSRLQLSPTIGFDRGQRVLQSSHRFRFARRVLLDLTGFAVGEAVTRSGAPLPRLNLSQMDSAVCSDRHPRSCHQRTPSMDARSSSTRMRVTRPRACGVLSAPARCRASVSRECPQSRTACC